MEPALKNFGRDELIRLQLRGLFEQRGFRRARVNKFEDYALYVDNKNFLQCESIITFMDLNGKLLALKPDVTLSVVRNMPNKALPVPEKLYYTDEVYRLSRENREYKVRQQIGVELIGPHNPFSNIEIVDLALASLALIGESFVLDISHLGFVSGLLDSMELNHGVKKQVMAAIHAKSAHDVAAALEQAGIPQPQKSRVMALCDLHGSLLQTLSKARELICCEQMQEAYNELAALAAVMRQTGQESRINLDFSVVNDLDYYNGLIFLGYIEGIPKVVLTGGRYDNLMRKMGKESGAIGFAVSLDDLSLYLKSGKAYDFDMLALYPPDCDYAALLACVKQYNEQGISLRLECEGCDLTKAGFSWGKLCRWQNNGFTEVASC